MSVFKVKVNPKGKNTNVWEKRLKKRLIFFFFKQDEYFFLFNYKKDIVQNVWCGLFAAGRSLIISVCFLLLFVSRMVLDMQTTSHLDVVTS